MSVAIEVKSLVKEFGDVPVVRNVSFSVVKGEILGLLGASGCGKTTILKCLAGLEQPTTGEIRIHDKLVAGPGRFLAPERRKIGMVFQSYALWPHKTVFKNVSYPLEIRKVKKGDIRARVLDTLKTVGLDGFGGRYPRELSGGQQQRVALARSLVYEPSVLLFDEPLSNLDATLRVRVRDELKELLNRLSITAVYVTHDYLEAMALCDRAAMMDGGNLVQLDAPSELYRRPSTAAVARLVGSGTILPGELLDGQTVLVKDLRVCVPTLDGMAAGSSVQVLLRRESIRLSRPSAGVQDRTNTWPGSVISRTSFGAHDEYLVELDSGVRLVANVDARTPVMDGRIVASAAPEGVVLLPPD